MSFGASALSSGEMTMEHIGFAGVGFLWACVGVTVGYIYATRADYRDPAREPGAHRKVKPSFEATRQVPRMHVVARASVPASNRASLALTGLCDASWTSTHRSRAIIRRHKAGATGRDAIWETDGKGLMLAIR